jgi:hypothetical protein
MVSLDFFCFVFDIKKKNESPRFVATEAHLLRRRNAMKERQTHRGNQIKFIQSPQKKPHQFNGKACVDH